MISDKARLPTDELTFPGVDNQKCGTIKDMKRNSNPIGGQTHQVVLRLRRGTLAVMLTLSLLAGMRIAQADVESAITAYESGNFEAAAAEFLKQSDDSRAAYYLGLMHEGGLGGLLKNYTTALNWMEKSGHSGYIKAQLKAASMNENGLGAPQSFKKAAEWYRRAAAKGDARGQLRLGTLYRDGIGVPRDRYRASLWLGRAGKQGNPDAIQALQGLRRQGLISERELVMRLAGVSETGMTITERGERVREQLAHMLDPIKFFVGHSKRAVPARELNDHWIIVERENDVLALLTDVFVSTDEGDIVEVGTVRILAVPEENDTLDFTLSIPSRLLVRNSLGKIISTITHDQFEISGKWSEALRTSTDGAVRWRGVAVLVEEGPLQIDIGMISGRFLLSQIGSAIWRQASGIEINSLRAATAGGAGVFRIGRAAFRGEVDGAHPDAYKRFVHRHVAGYEGPRLGNQDSTKQAVPESTDIESQIAAILGQRLEASLEFSDLFVDAGDGSPPIELASGSVLVGLSGLDQALSALELKFGYDGLKAFGSTSSTATPDKKDEPNTSDNSVAGANTSGPASGQGGLADLSREVPNRVALDIVIERVPLRGIATAVLGRFIESMAGALKGGQAAPTQSDAAQFGQEKFGMMPLLFQSTGELMKAGTRIVLNRLEIYGSDYGVMGSGAIDADSAAVYQVSGEFDLAMTNLQKALQYQGTQAFFADGVALVETLDDIGNVGATEGAKNYRVEVTQLGAILINGHDLAALLREVGNRAK